MSETEPGFVSMLWTLMVSWFTPTVLFCVLNLMIATIFISSNIKSHKTDQNHQHGEDHSPHQLVRVPSLLERVRSFNFSLYKSEHQYPLHPETQFADQTHHVIRSKSDASGDAPEKVPAAMTKSASEKSVVTTGVEDEEEVERRRPATVRERKGKGVDTASFGEEECVDAKADDFINRFKQQLKLQRLDSLLRYKDMLKRGF